MYWDGAAIHPALVASSSPIAVFILSLVSCRNIGAPLGTLVGATAAAAPSSSRASAMLARGRSLEAATPNASAEHNPHVSGHDAATATPY